MSTRIKKIENLLRKFEKLKIFEKVEYLRRGGDEF